MAVKNTLDGSFEIGFGSVVPITLSYAGLINASYPSFYAKVGNMCVLYLPSITETPITSSPSVIQINIPTDIVPKKNQIIHGFSVNDADGTQNSVLELGEYSNLFILGKETSGGIPGQFNNTSPVSITRYRYIIYQLFNE